MSAIHEQLLATEMVLGSDATLPDEMVNYHRAVAGTIYQLFPPTWFRAGSQIKQSDRTDYPNIMKTGAEMVCEGCPAVEQCNPHTIVRNDRRIQTMGTHAGDQFCKLK